MSENITVTVAIKGTPEQVWHMWTLPEHIQQWNHASDDWHCPYAENDLRVGGRFLARMSAKDGSASFDFTGVYTAMVPYECLAYTMDDGRTVSITFKAEGDTVMLTETFDPEQENTHELQRAGWQSILDNFKEYTERLI